MMGGKLARVAVLRPRYCRELSSVSSRVSVNIREDDGIAVVALDRPAKYNGLDMPMFHAVADAAREMAKNESVRAVVLKGEGKVFSAGIDVNSLMKGMSLKPIDVLLRRESEAQVACLAQEVAYLWREVPAPVIAAVHGVCFGGGLQIALGADVRFASPSCKLSVMEAKWGLIPDMSATVTMRELMGIDQAKMLTMTGRVMPAADALEYGLVSELAEDPEEAAVRHACELIAPYATQPRSALADLKLKLLAERHSLFQPHNPVSVSPTNSLSGNITSQDPPAMSVSADGVAVLSLIGDKNANSINVDSLKDLNANVKCVVLELGGEKGTDSGPDNRADRGDVHAAANVCHQCAVPVFAVLRSGCTPQQVALSLGCDFRFCDDGTKLPMLEEAIIDFGDTDNSIHAWLYQCTGAERMQRLVTLFQKSTEQSQSLSKNYLGISGAQARELGVVTKCTAGGQAQEDAMQAALTVATTLATKGSPDQLVATKYLFDAAWGADEATALAVETVVQRQLLLSYNMIACASRNLGPLKLPFKARKATIRGCADYLL